jgi:hypothetical protein
MDILDGAVSRTLLYTVHFFLINIQYRYCTGWYKANLRFFLCRSCHHLYFYAYEIPTFKYIILELHTFKSSH